MLHVHVLDFHFYNVHVDLPFLLFIFNHQTYVNKIDLVSCSLILLYIHVHLAYTSWHEVELNKEHVKYTQLLHLLFVWTLFSRTLHFVGSELIFTPTRLDNLIPDLVI